MSQDIFEWAGQLRTVDIQNQDSHFQQVSAIAVGSDFCFGEQCGPLLRAETVSDADFVTNMATLFEQINYLHPFREGNGRTQRVFLDQVAAQSGRTLFWRNVSRADHIAASIQCHEKGSGEPYEQMFAKIIKREGRCPHHQS